MNPPRVGLNYAEAEAIGIVYGATAPPDFRPEFVNAFEAGAKNTLLGGGLVLNASAFYYDYKDYQLSKIVDRSANNENFDANVWGLELETFFSPTRDWRFNFSVGYLNTEIGEGSFSIDVMNRTAGRTDWVLVKPAVTLMSNCIAPLDVVIKMIDQDNGGPHYYSAACPGGNFFGGHFRGGTHPFGLETTLPDGTTYDPADYPEANYGAGFFTDISGNDLPNAPHWTSTLGAQKSWDLPAGWRATLRGDLYWQSQQWARPYQLPIDKIHAWKNGNVSIKAVQDDAGLELEFYIKNIFNDTPITDTFINSDDTALTTNIFVLDPRLIGFWVRKSF